MTLLAKWQGKIRLPEVPETISKIGDNFVVQRLFPGGLAEVQVFDSKHAGYGLVKTKLSPPYDKLLLRHRGIQRIKTNIPILAAPGVETLDNLYEETEYRWDNLGEIAQFANTPERVLRSWINKFVFQLEDEEQDLPGLRKPQIGALHAISAHFSVGSEFEAATIVLPTGTGKTETMLAAQVYGRLEKTLVIVPSDALRTQIFGKFVSLGVLPNVGVLPHEIARPHVCRVTKAIRTVEEAQALVEKSNAIIALPNILQTSNPEAVEHLIQACTDLVVDEAHHITAHTWASIRDRFETKRIIQFTATPFRREGKKIDGKIIFNYKLGDAQKAGYYRPINLKTIEEYGDTATRDRSIAVEAIAALRRDRLELGLDHLLMARTSKKQRADEIWAIYNQLAPEFRPVVVYSGSGRTLSNRTALNQILDRGENGSRIVVCVDMLGEGFDLPNLKIAALHDTHKSLAVTLQFIGRFTRKGAVGQIGEATVITNIADPEAEAKLADLYAEGADWDMLIKRLSEDRIDEELRLQDVVLGLKENGNLHTQLSLWNLRPALSTQIYRTTCLDWSPLEYKGVLPKDAESWYSISDEDHVLVIVVHRSGAVRWGNYQNLIETTYDLILAWWDKERGALFVYSSDYDGLGIEQIAKEITRDTAELLSGPAIFNILNNVELPLAKSLGSSRIGAISFTSYFGPNVTEGLASIEKAESELNNIACLGYEDGERVVWGGAKRKGKVWQQKSGTISEWIKWCKKTWTKVSSADDVEPNITRDFLRPTRLSAPHTSEAIAVLWGELAQMAFSDRQFIVFGDHEVPLFVIDLDIMGVNIDGSITIRISSEDVSSEYVLNISSAFKSGYEHRKVSGPDVFFRKSNGTSVALEEHLVIDPFIIRYADGTHSYNCYHIQVRLNAGTFPKARLEAWDWTDIPLNRESMNKQCNEDTIQYKTFEAIREEYDVVFNDDGPGEAADLVALKDVDDETIRLCLIHCKGAVDGAVSNDIRNFYTVCGQAQKSITAKHQGVPRLYLDLKRRHEIWVRDGFSRFLKGDMKLLSYFKEKARRSQLIFEVVIVQPGASIRTIGEDALKLLATTELFLKKTTEADFRVVISK